MLLAATALTLLAAAPSPRPALRVSLQPDPSLPCPAGEALAAALRRAMPDVEVREDDGSAPAPEDLLVAVAPQGGGWSLSLWRAGGGAVLTRSLDAGGDRGCAELADAGALIVDRYLADVAWPGRAPQVAPLLPPPPPPRPPVLLGPPWSLAVGPLGVAGLPLDAAAGLAVEAGGALGGWGRAGLRLAVARDLDRSILAGAELRGAVRVWSAQALLVAGPCGALGPSLRGCARAAAGALGANVSAGGYVYQQRARTFALPAAGAVAGAAWAPFPSLELGAEASALARMGQVSVVVEGTSAGYQTPWAEVGVWLFAGWRVP
ncbi:MAG TPA: hypothetical protein VND93_02725 [Myxococcales bacterium]|nr:hypothetical protein [Myxococcales bacterium]